MESQLVPSMGQLWLRNLRLLDLDRLTDWPSKLTAQTFKEDDIRTRKVRIRRAEWILFRLFEIWSPRECRTLAPLFPALEPAQSIHLRTTLLNLLSSLKQEGHLGTCALRKSLLEDCFGPRFEHLLLAFSTLVLQKTVLEQGRSPSVALTVATDANHAETDMEAFSVLHLAHQASLQKAMQAKQLVQMRTEGLEAYIHFKELTMQAQDDFARDGLSSLEAELIQAGIDSKDLKKKLRIAAGPDEAWMNILISGESSMDRDAMVEDSFSSLWNRTQKGSDFQQHPPIESGFLADLESRLGEQQERLKKWRRFQSRLSERNGDLIVARTPLETPRRTPGTSARKSPTKTLRRAGTVRETPSPRKKELVSQSAAPAAAAAAEQATGKLRDALLETSLPPPVMVPPLKRSSSLRQNPGVSDGPSQIALSPNSSHPPQFRGSLRRRSRSELVSYSEHRSNPVKVDTEVVDDISNRVSGLHIGSTPQTLAERTRGSLAHASRRPEAHSNKTTGSGSVRVPSNGEDESPSATDSPLAAKSSQHKQVSLAERAQISLREQESAGPQRPNPERRPTRSKAQARLKPHSAPTDDASLGMPNADGIAQVSLTSSAGVSAEEKTPSDVLFAEAADAESIFKTRARVRRSPPPSG